ncbi:MAG: flagellar protein FlaF [Candidatus Tokpelaia sp. JSC188]|nr:MAG: flagellar protein FlaF [Candidatus Tokpelaia sp. JSC188]
MYQMRYEDTIGESVQDAREREALLFKRCIKLLQIAQKAESKSPEIFDAVVFVRNLWGILIEDLSKSGNAFSKEMKASIISVGLFILKEIDRLEKEEKIDFDAVIAVSQSICDGLITTKITN